MSTFRAIWPIIDETLDPFILVGEARTELPDLAARAHAELTGEPRWHVEPSVAVPGSGCVSRLVLVCDAPARPMPRRAYWRGAA